MQVEIHGKPSFSKNGARAQVIVLVGEGRNRRSITKHAERRAIGPTTVGYFGLNPDERAIPLNEKYEAELAETKSDLTSAEAALRILQKKLEEVGDVDPSKVDEINIAAAKAMLEGMIETVKLEVYAAEFIVDDAKSKLDQVRQDLPLEVEFVGGDL